MLAMKQKIEKRSEECQMQGARSAAVETYLMGRRERERRATPQMTSAVAFHAG